MLATVFRKNIALEYVARVAPNIFFGENRSHPLQKRREYGLIFFFKRLAAKYGKPTDKIRFHCVYNFLLGLHSKLFAVTKIPRFFVEAAFAGISAAGNEQRNAHSQPVCDVRFFYISVVH